MYVSTSVTMCGVCVCMWKPEEAAGSAGAGVTVWVLGTKL